MKIIERPEIKTDSEARAFLTGRGWMVVRTEPGEFNLWDQAGILAGEASLSQGHLVVMTEVDLPRKKTKTRLIECVADHYESLIESS